MAEEPKKEESIGSIYRLGDGGSGGAVAGRRQKNEPGSN